MMTHPYFDLFYDHFLDFAPILIGSLLLWSGFRGFQNPVTFANTFGTPNATPSEVIFLQSATGRNIAAGLFIWILVYLQERSLGLFLLCWTWAGIADTKLLYEHPRGEKQSMHMRNILVLSVLGPLLIWSMKD